ncbi:MAG: glutamate--tRNA ligase family protein, partial [Nitrososphaerales archaeon]
SEFAFRDELQNLIRHHLNQPNPVYVEFARFEFRGVPTSKRIIRELIEKKVVTGWDDPRLSTIEAIRRRGLLPETLREFTYTYAGVSFAKKEYDWSLVYSINRKLVDSRARRFFFVPNPVKLVLRNFAGARVEIPYHPSLKLGKRTLEAGKTVYISGDDAAALNVGDIFRCKMLANVRVLEIYSGEIVGEVVGVEPLHGVKIVQWVPENYVEVKVFKYEELIKANGSINMESVKEIRGYGESYLTSVDIDEIVQFERFGFVRVDSVSPFIAYFAHQ